MVTCKSLCRKEANVHTPHNASQRTQEVSSLHRLDEGKVDERDKGPQLVASRDERPELLLGLGPDEFKVDGAKVDGVGLDPVVHGLAEVGDAGRAVAGHAQRAREGAEEERVGGRAEGLVEQELDGRIALGQRGRRRRVVALFGVDGGLRIRGERRLDKLLPKEQKKIRY